VVRTWLPGASYRERRAVRHAVADRGAPDTAVRHPVAGLPLETLAAGGSLAIVNRGSTPFDSRASVTIDGGAGETLRALAGALAERP
jgi:hypothetical protein